MSRPAAIERAVEGYRARTGREPNLVVRAPGRVNLIGEHTDYNDGFVLPMALPFEIVIAGEARDDDTIAASSEGFDPIEFSIGGDAPAHHWGIYVHGMAQLLRGAGHRIRGWQAHLASDIPAGASLSSSAAIEIASGLACLAAAGSTIEPNELARLGQRVENEILGLPSGIMDQLASAAAVAGTASLIDCRDLSMQHVPVPPGVDIVIMDTGTRRELVDSAYAARRTDCATAAGLLGLRALRDATLAEVDSLSDDRLRRRAHHVVSENRRTLDAAEAMRSGDSSRLGALMNASHASLRDDFEVSGPALDAMVDLAQAVPGCLGARMTGGGFAGAAVALVSSEHTTTFVETVSNRFVAPPAQPSVDEVRLFAVRPAAGASVITAPPAT